LKKEMQTTELFNFEVTVRWIQEEPTSIEASFRKLKTHHLKLLQYDIHPTPEECRRYVDAITCGFREDDKVQFLARSGHASLHESYNAFLKASQPVGGVNDHSRALAPEKQVTSSSSESTAEYDRIMMQSADTPKHMMQIPASLPSLSVLLLLDLGTRLCTSVHSIQAKMISCR
jgi:hypothetical protein